MVIPAQISYTFPFPSDKVFDAWLTPEMIGNWMFGPNVRDEEVVSIEIDARVGGEFSFLVNRQNTVIDHIGKYLVIDRPRRLEFEWGVKGMKDNSKVIVEIAPKDSGCELTLTHELHPDWKDYFERTKEGWTMMMGKLEEALKATA